MAGSPYVNEGVIDRMKSQAAKGIQAGAAMMGHQLEDPRVTKVKSLWESFSTKLHRLLSDVQTNIIPLVSHNAERPTPQQKALMDQFTELYHTIVPPKVKASQLYNALKETMGDVLNRDMALNKVLASNDTDKILNAYKERVVKLYQNFLNDVSKMLQIPRNVVEGAVLRFLPQTSYRNTVDALKTIQASAPLVKNPSAQGAIPTAANAGAAGAGAAGGAGTQPPQTTTGASPSSSGSNYSKDDIGLVVLNVVELIINTVSADPRSKKFMELPMDVMNTWDTPPVTKQGDDEHHNDNNAPYAGIDHEEPAEAEPLDENDDENKTPEEPEKKGEWLYNFHSKVKKYPGDAFNYPVNPSLEPLRVQLSNNRVKELQVIWSVKEKHENNIFIKHKPAIDASSMEQGSYETTLLFKFYDDQANPRNKSGFSIEMVLAQAHPSKPQLLKDISPELRAQIDELNEKFLRACYATTTRKHMEFSPKGLNIRMSNTGRVLNIKRDGVHEEVPEDSIEFYLQDDSSKVRQKWLEALTRIKWFGFTGKDKHTAYETPAPEEAAAGPIKLIPLDGKIESQLSPQAEDAVTALTQVSPWNKDIPLIKKYVGISEKELGEHATAEEIANNALAKMKSAMKGGSTPEKKPEAPEPIPAVSTSPSKPAGEAPKENPISAPVSKEPSKSVGGAKVSAPVSNADKSAVEKSKDVGSVKFDDKGNVEWTKPDGTVRKFTAKQINNMASPRLKKALTKSGYPFEKHGITNLKETKGGLINPFQIGNLL